MLEQTTTVHKMSHRRQEERDYNVVCPVCQDEFQDPVIIECHHSFCRSCIEAWIDNSPIQDLSMRRSKFRCPSCKTTNKIPFNGVSGFPKSFYIEQLMDAKSRSQSSYPMCPKHKTEDLRFYCKDCETTMCRDCKVLKHEGHTGECVSDVANEMRAKLNDSVKQANQDLADLEIAEDLSKKDAKTVAKLKKSARNMVKSQVQEIKGTIDNIAAYVDHEICRHFQVYETEIGKEMSVTEVKSAALQTYRTTVIQEIKSGSDHDIIANYKEFIEDRNSIVVKDKKMLNPVYKIELANVYCKGNIKKDELKSMVGAVLSGQRSIENAKEVDLETSALSSDALAVSDAKREGEDVYGANSNGCLCENTTEAELELSVEPVDTETIHAPEVEIINEIHLPEVADGYPEVVSVDFLY